MSATIQDMIAPIPLVERGKSFLLAGDPKGKNILYGSGNVLIIRDIANPKKCDIYREHANKVIVGRYAPHGNYICSADVTGKIKIWDAVGDEHKEKNEFRPFSGEVRDLAWGPEGKRIAVCGQGNEKHAAVIMADSGNSLGDLSQVNKRGNSIDMKPTRPYRLIIGDDEFYVSVYEGPPFKPKLEIIDHSRFVNCVRYSPDGKYWASAGSDGRMYLYDGKTSEKVGFFGDEKKGAHGGGIYQLCWSPDGKEILTASGDKSAKIWNVDTREEVAHFVIGKDLSDQQYSCLWVGDTLITLSLNGCLNYLDRNNPEKPLRIVRGHSRQIAKVIHIPGDTPRHVTGEITGKMMWWDTDSGEGHEFGGTGHSNKIVGLAYDPDRNKIVSVAWDDKLCFTCATALDFTNSSVVALDSQPRSLALAGNGYVVVNTEAKIILFKDEKKVFEVPHLTKNFVPTGFAASGNLVAVETDDKSVKIFKIEGDALVDSGTEIEGMTPPEAISFSPDGSMLTVVDAGKALKVLVVADEFKMHGEKLWGHHMKPTTICWSPDSKVMATTGMDNSIWFWNVADSTTITVKRAHGRSFIHALAWMNNNCLISTGDDSVTIIWNVSW